MAATEITVKGIITRTAPYGEYGRRVSIITDKLGRITAFASGAAKARSKIIGAVRPLTNGVFTLAKGRSAYNLHTVEVMDSFDTLSGDFEAYTYACYVLETAEYFSTEGMPEKDAKALLNLMFVTLSALRDKKLSSRLICGLYELRLLYLAGEYTETPPASGNAGTAVIWSRCLDAPLARLYDPAGYKNNAAGAAAGVTAGTTAGAAAAAAEEDFIINARELFKRQTGRSFKALELSK